MTMDPSSPTIKKLLHCTALLTNPNPQQPPEEERHDGGWHATPTNHSPALCMHGVVCRHWVRAGGLAREEGVVACCAATLLPLARSPPLTHRNSPAHPMHGLMMVFPAEISGAFLSLFVKRCQHYPMHGLVCCLVRGRPAGEGMVACYHQPPTLPCPQHHPVLVCHMPCFAQPHSSPPPFTKQFRFTCAGSNPAIHDFSFCTLWNC